MGVLDMNKLFQEKLKKLHSIVYCPKCAFRIRFFKGLHKKDDNRYYSLVACKCGLQKNWKKMAEGWYPELLEDIFADVEEIELQTDLEADEIWHPSSFHIPKVF